MEITASDLRVLRGPHLWVSAAWGAVAVLVLPFVLVDLWTSVHEARVLHAGVVCTGDVPADCLAQGDVALGPFNDAVRTRMVSVYVSDVDAEPGDSDLVDLLPADYPQVFDFGERAVAHRVDGRVVALSGTTGSQRVVPAMAGIHAVVVDASVVVALVGLVARGFGLLRASRRAGLGWTDRMPATLGIRRRRPDVLLLVGGFSLVVAFILATYDVRAWVTAAVLAAVIWWGPRVERRLRRNGRHAA